MLNIFSKATSVAAVVVISTFAQTQPSAQPAQPQWKDGQVEWNMFSAAQKETDPKKKLALTDAWKQKYPETEFKLVRLQLYLNAYQQLNEFPHLLATLNDMLALNPSDLTVMSPILYYTVVSNDASPAALENAEKVARTALANLDHKPPAITDEQWPQARTQIESLAHKALGWVAMQRKNGETAQQEFIKSLQIDANQGEVDYWLGNTLRADKTPAKICQALFYFARAATYDGPGALPPQGRQQLDDYLRKAYNSYHGQDDAGLNQLRTLAKAQAFPPEGFKIESAQEVALRKQQEFQQSNPQLAMWMTLKQALTGPDGQQFFDSSMKGAQVPGGAQGVQTFKATVIAARPGVRSKELVVGLADPKVAEVTLKLDTPVPGKPAIGGEIEFEGVPTEFTADPFHITFEVERAKIKGLKVEAAPATRKAGAPHKKG